jgi:outer membrane protein TolC
MTSLAGIRRKVVVSVAFLLWVGMVAFAQSSTGSDPVFPADPFVLAYEAAVADYRSTMDFSQPLAPAGNLQDKRSGVPAGVVPKPPYSLDELLAMAAAGNPGLMAMAEAESAAMADYAGARARRLPTLKAETSGSYIGNPMDAIMLPAGGLGELYGVSIPPQDTIINKGMENTNYDFKLVGDLPLFTWGKIELGIDLARTGIGAATLQTSKAEHELAIAIRGNWDALAYVVKAEGILALQKKIGARLVEISEKSEAAGFLTKADLASARIKLKEIDMAAARLAEQRDRLLSELASTTGLHIESPADLQLVVQVAGTPRWTAAEAFKLVSEGSFDLALLDVLLESKRGLRDMAEKEAKGLPDIGLHVELSYGGARLPFLETDWFGQDDWQLSFSLGTTGNIFGNPVKAGEAAKARAQVAESEAQKADAERSLRAYVRETYLGIELGKAQLEYAALKQDGWAADLAQMRATIRAGAGSESDYLGLMIEALGGLAEAYGTLAEYRGALLSIEAVAGMAAER